MCNSELTRRMSCIHQEHALWLLKKRVVNKEWDKIMGPYWNSLPEQGTLNTKETFPLTASACCRMTPWCADRCSQPERSCSSLL